MDQKLNPKIAHTKAWISITLLIVLGLTYIAPTLTNQFVGDNDYWSNLLPIIHYRHSISDSHTLPLYTDLWYGGRAQWQNPLWSFLYFPATIIWLVLPLDWGTRIVIALHVIFSLIAGRKLSSLFLSDEMGRIPAAIILTAPMLPALLAGHVEKILSWGWLLLSIYFLLNEKNAIVFRGVGSGICWGIIALTGANYYVLYTGLLLLPILLSYKKLEMVFSFFGSSIIGLLHLPMVWYLIGSERGNPLFSISLYKTNILGVITSLISGFANPIGWETWALIGLPMVYLFIRSLLFDIKDSYIQRKLVINSQKSALFISLLLFLLLTTGTLYLGNHILDTFRVPARAIAFIAVAITLFVLMSYKPVTASVPNSKKKLLIDWLFIASALQICILTVIYIRPPGSVHGPYDPSAEKLVGILRADQANSVWMSIPDFDSMYIQVALTDNGIALPNVYYGDMGQEIPIRGPHCGYSFDHLVSTLNGGDITLTSDISYEILGTIPSENLQITNTIKLDNHLYYVYRVVCSENNLYNE